MPEMVLMDDRKDAVEQLRKADSIWSNVALPWGNRISFTLPSSFRGQSVRFFFFPVEDSSVAMENRGTQNCDDMAKALAGLPAKYEKGNWNGYDEKPLDNESYFFANEFAKQLPHQFRGADVGIDADGEVTFEWYRARDCQCSLTFAKSGNVYCVVRNGGDRIMATISSKASGKILDLIGEVVNG